MINYQEPSRQEKTILTTYKEDMSSSDARMDKPVCDHDYECIDHGTASYFKCLKCDAVR